MAARIVVCDDDVHIRLAVTMKLERAGFEVEAFSNGAEAWSAIERQTPDLVVTDWQMPRMGGRELCQRIAAAGHLADLPVLALTGKALELEAADLDGLCLRRVLNKPFSPRELLTHVQELLTLAEAGTAAAGIAGGVAGDSPALP